MQVVSGQQSFLLFFLSWEMKNLKLTDARCLLVRWSAGFDYLVATCTSILQIICLTCHCWKTSCPTISRNIHTVVHGFSFHSVMQPADKNKRSQYFFFFNADFRTLFLTSPASEYKTLHRNSPRNMLKSPQLWVGLWTPQIPIQSMFHGMWWRHGQREVHQAQRKRSHWLPSCSTGSAKRSPAHLGGVRKKTNKTHSKQQHNKTTRKPVLMLRLIAMATFINICKTTMRMGCNH